MKNRDPVNAIPTIAGELHGFSRHAWVFSAYMLASAVTVPIYGKLSGIWTKTLLSLFMRKP
ncbi:hypothetical protein Psfp_01984 [Pelotomaculum sp. FP]|uniref:hypothetical protein n=1 Tax=Pelotomaculum sp. FP TaxID=261474 RepID=UPI001064866C|nr:hypothetical protein [Pelotomaculum sp. FP]TEB15620.1 hypothetical protein Psfp_01984 [Pelotomaculum sp. FP]